MSTAWTDLNTTIFELADFQWVVVKPNGEPGGCLYSGDDVDLRINYVIECKQPWSLPFLWRAKIEAVLDGQRGYMLDDLSFRWGEKDNALISVSGKMPPGKDLSGKIIFSAGFWGGFPPMPPPVFTKFAEAPISILNLDDIPLPTPPDGIPPTVCTEGQERCVGYNREICQNSQWKVKEYNSPDCGYTPEPICTSGEDRCIGTTLQVCIGDHWETKEKNSARCGYIPPDGEPTPPTDGEGIGGWFDRNKTAIIIVSAAVLVISIIVLATKARVQSPVAAWPKFQPPIVRK